MIVECCFLQLITYVCTDSVEPKPPFAHQLLVDVGHLDVAGIISQPGEVVVVVSDGFL